MALSDLPTLADVQADRKGKPLWKSPITRLDVKVAAEKDERGQLDRWRRAVRTRDRGRCRVCGRKVKVTLELDPLRCEIHHIVGRADKAIRHDVRNGLTVCKTHHDQLTRHKLHVIGTAAMLFTASNGKSYLDANCALTFTEAKP
jgi:HNH endonuclease